MAPARPRTPSGSGPVALATTIVVIAGLYFGRAALLPVAIACLISFLLAPLVDRLRAWRFPKALAVLASVGLAIGVVAVVATAVTVQVVDLANSLPEYEDTIERKLEAIRGEANGPGERLMKMIRGLNERLGGRERAQTPQGTDGQGDGQAGPIDAPPVPVEVVTEPLTPLEMLGSVVGTAIGPLAMAGIVAVFVIFILLAREDIRTRVVRLLGARPGEIYTSTRALDDAAERVSRYLVMQLVLNASYGVPIGLGLFLIGVPNATLWAILAMVLRFVPYIGPWIAAAFPLAMAFAVSPAWAMVLWTAGLFIVVEIIWNNAMEPWLYGASTGISPLGILLAAMFWGFLWGPVGLLVSTPLTVCLVVLGRYVPALKFFSLLLGDQPAIPLYARIYQRLLAMDPDEPDELALKYLESHSAEEYFTEVVLPLLRLFEEERHYHALERDHRDFIIAQARDLIEHATDGVEGEARAPRPSEGPQRPCALCVPAHDESDELVAIMLAALLNQAGCSAKAVSSRLLASERIEMVADARPEVVCVSALPPYATVHTINTVKRLRSRIEGAIVVGFWQASPAGPELSRRLTPLGKPEIVGTLQDARARVLGLRGDAQTESAKKSAHAA